MAKNIHEFHKKCLICGKEFVTNYNRKITCSTECAKKRDDNLRKENQEHVNALARKNYHKRKRAAEKKINIAMEAHKLRMQQQREAREVGLSYAQYIAMDADCIERWKKQNAKAY